MNSLWMKTTPKPTFNCLERDKKTDVLIVGGGMAGLLIAHKLCAAGVDCILLEGDRICGGVTENTTAKITSQHGLIYDKLIKTYGIEKAQGYLLSHEMAIAEYRKMCSKIDCDFEEQTAFVYTKDRPDKIEAEMLALEKLGYKVTYEWALPLPIATKGAIGFRKQAQFHPLKFAYAIAKDLPVFEQSKVLELAPHKARTAHGTVTAKHIVVATHFPFLNKHGLYFLKMYQDRSYILALKNAKKVNGMYIDENEKGLSFRDADGLLLLGGASHRTGGKGGGFGVLEAQARQCYPDAEIAYRWATQDCVTLDKIAYIGQYSRNTDGLYVATGFNKWGMTSSMVAAGLLCDLLLEKRNAFAPIFSPSRSMLHPTLAQNAASSIYHLLTPTVPRCPHLGCALKYNKEEHSWDCPCHGSRFAEDGKLLNNPATSDKKQ